MIKTSSVAAAAYFAAAAMTASAQTNTPATPVQSASIDQTQVDQGKMAYAQKCSHCHGPGMVNAGTIAPDLRRFPDDQERFLTTVKLGKNGRMPPWGDLLSDDQMMSLWAYVASRRNP